MLLNVSKVIYVKQIKQVTFLFPKLNLISSLDVFMIELKQSRKLGINGRVADIFMNRYLEFELKMSKEHQKSNGTNNWGGVAFTEIVKD